GAPPRVGQRQHVGHDSGDPGALLAARLFGGRRGVDGNGERCRGLQRRCGLAVPQARRRDRGGDREDRRAPQSRRVMGRPRVSWPRDDAKLERVRSLMTEQELDALVVRAPDNVLYLTNFWGMKGFEAVVVPREGAPLLIGIVRSAQEPAGTAGSKAMRLFPGFQ